MNSKDYAAYVEKVDRAREGIQFYSRIPSTCPECYSELDDIFCPNCDCDIEAYCEPSFSSSPCDLCNSSGGNLTTLYVANETYGTIEYEVCSDCEYYLEHGVLDDTTMLEVSMS